jgi:hypothetical protein
MSNNLDGIYPIQLLFFFGRVFWLQLVMNNTLCYNYNSSFLNVCCVIFRSVSLYFECIKLYYCILFWQFSSHFVYITLCFCVSLLSLIWLFPYLVKKIYGKIDDMNMNSNLKNSTPTVMHSSFNGEAHNTVSR